MNKIGMISFLKKYKRICDILNLNDDVRSFEEIISFINSEQKNATSEKRQTIKIDNKDVFRKITNNEDTNSLKYKINQEILNNKANMLNFWTRHDISERKKFTILELNLIMYFLTDKNNNYTENKKEIMNNIDMTVRGKQAVSSYDNIKV
jgi:hypothetical protein